MWWAKKNTEPHKKAFRFEVTAKYFAICGRFHVFDQVNVPDNGNKTIRQTCIHLLL